MDSDEDVSARILLRNVLHTEPPRTPVIRSSSGAQPSAQPSALRRSSRLRRSSAGAPTPTDALRRSMRQRLHESTSRMFPSPSKRRTVLVRLRRMDTSASDSLLNDDVTPRHLLKGILQTEAETSLVQARTVRMEPELPPADSSLNRNRPSTGMSDLELPTLSDLDLPNMSTINLGDTVKGLSRKRPRRSLNVTDFQRGVERRLQQANDVEKGGGDSLDDLSSLSTNSLDSVNLSLKTPVVDVRTERRGLRRKVPNRREIVDFEKKVEDFYAAVQNRLGEGHPEPSDITEHDITSDVIVGSQDLYAKSFAKSVTISHAQDEDSVTATMMEGGKKKGEENGGELSGVAGQGESSVRSKQMEEENILESQTEEEEGAESQTEEEEVAESQTGEEEGAESQTGEEEGAESQTEEEEVAESQTGEEEGAESQTGEEEGAESQTGEEEEGTESQTGEEEEGAESQIEEEGAESQTGEEEGAESQIEEEGAESQTGEEEGAESQIEEEVAESQTGEEEVAESQTGEEEEGAESQTGEEEEVADSQTGEEEEVAESQMGEEEEGAESQIEEEGAESQIEEEGAESQIEEEGAESQIEEEGAESQIEEEGAESQIEEEGAESQTGEEEVAESQMGEEPQTGGEEEGGDYQTGGGEEGAGSQQLEEWEEEEEEDGSECEDSSMTMPAWVTERRQALPIDPLVTPTVARVSTGAAVVKPGKAKPPKRAGPAKKKKPELPKSYIMNAFKHFAKTRVSADVYPVLKEIMNRYFDRLADDLEAYAAHAKRTTIEVADVELLLRRQGFVTDAMPVNVLIEKYLPMEYRRLLIPCATGGNNVFPKQRR